MKNFVNNYGGYVMAVLLVGVLLEFLTVVTIAGLEINDFNNEVKFHNSHHHFKPHQQLKTVDLSLAVIDLNLTEDSIKKFTSISDTTMASLNTEFCISLDHLCPICAGRKTNSRLIRTIWPLFAIKN